MNRYLIVVFCVLTGCAAAVPTVNGQGLSADQLLFANWYADHVRHLEDSFASPLLAQVEQEQITGACCSNPKELSVLKNLPEIPALHQKKIALNFPLHEAFTETFGCFEVYCNQIPESDRNIRAPGL